MPKFLPLLLPLALLLHGAVYAQPNPRQLAFITDPLWLEASLLPLLAAIERPQQPPELTNIGLAHCLNGGEFSLTPMQLQLGQRLRFSHCQRDDWRYRGVLELALDDEHGPAHRFNLALLPLVIREGQGPALRIIWHEQGEFTPGGKPWRWQGEGSALISNEQPQFEVLEFYHLQRRLSLDGDNQLQQQLMADILLDKRYQLRHDSICQLNAEAMPRCRLLRLRLTEDQRRCWQWPDTNADCQALVRH